MGKRTIRLRQQDLPEKISEIPANIDLHIVLNNGKTVMGKLESHFPSGFSLSSGQPAWYNKKSHLHTLLWTEILEIEYDLPTLY
jgi:hypothetical protein